MPIYKTAEYERKKIMNLHSTWPGTYSFVFELRAILNAFRAYIDTVLKKIDAVEEKIASQETEKFPERLLIQGFVWRKSYDFRIFIYTEKQKSKQISDGRKYE